MYSGRKEKYSLKVRSNKWNGCNKGSAGTSAMMLKIMRLKNIEMK